MSERSLFSPRLLAAWIAAAFITFSLSIYFALRDEDGVTAGPNSYSISAIGYAGLADILEKLGVEVVKSRGGSLHRVSEGGVLVLAEPDVSMAGETGLAALLGAHTVLVVLPKWRGAPDSQRRSWISLALPVPPHDARSVLREVAPKGDVVRPDKDEAWTTNEIGPVPLIVATAQLITSDELKPIVGGPGGMLVGEKFDHGRRIWVVADPDVLDNHGLGDGNARFAVQLLDKLRKGGNVVFDETIHGFETVPGNPAKLLFRKPFSAVTIQAIIATALLLWATTGRFGAPEAAPPPLKAGKRSLIENVARLLAYAGHQRMLVRRYVEATIRDVAQQLHAPRGRDGLATLGWVRRVAEARGATIDFMAVSARAEALAAQRTADLGELFGVARDIRRWKQEMLDGSSGGARDHGRGAR